MPERGIERDEHQQHTDANEATNRAIEPFCRWMTVRLLRRPGVHGVGQPIESGSDGIGRQRGIVSHSDPKSEGPIRSGQAPGTV